MNKISVAVLGATGSVGQRFVQLLAGHPWFELAAVSASKKRSGKLYGEACHWVLPQAMPENAAGLTLSPSEPEFIRPRLVFSALPSSSAAEIEGRFARAGALVCSNAGAYRMEADIPLLLPEVNPDHAVLLDLQRKLRVWNGGIVTNPNCTSTGLTVVLKALDDAFGVRQVVVVSLQAVSGAGYPGVPALDVMGNVVPFIPGEEEKVAREPLKMLGKLSGGEIEPAEIAISAHCNRVPVREGHTLCLSVGLASAATVAEVIAQLQDYQPPEVSRGLPSTPQPVIRVRPEPDRPQPLLDLPAGSGMVTVVGRVRQDAVLDLRLALLSHNTIRGAAGGSIYNAELLKHLGYVSEAGFG